MNEIMASSEDVRREIASAPGAVTTRFDPSRGGDSSYFITESNGKVYEWNDFSAVDAQLTEHEGYEEAAESIIAGCEALYLEFHGIDECDITRVYEGDRLVGFRLSRDADGSQHGDDETFGGCVVQF